MRVFEMTHSGRIAGLNSTGGAERVPFLEDVLDLVRGRQPVVIELKNRKRPCALEPEVSRILRDYQGDVAIHSFNPFSLGWFRRNHPGLCRGQISCSFDTDDMAGWKKLILAHYGMNWMSRPQFISHHWKQLPAIVPTCSAGSLRKCHCLHGPFAAVKEQSAALRLCRQCFLRDVHSLPAATIALQSFRTLLIKQSKKLLF